MKNKNKAALTALLIISLSSCKQTYYKYDLEKICDACEDHGGVNRFISDMDVVVVTCDDGEFVRLK